MDVCGRKMKTKRICYLALPNGMKTADIIWVVRKTRSVEFLVKPGVKRHTM